MTTLARETSPAALEAADEYFGVACRRILAPPPRLTVSEWADRFRMLSREASAEPGKWQTSRAPYQRGIMDALSEPMVERVVFVKASQVGATELLNNICGYFIDQDPGPMLVLMPTVDLAKAWSKDRLAPMLRDSPRLRGKVKDARSRDSENTILHKKFPGGQLTATGANSPSSLSSRPIRAVLCDEVDRYPISAGSEGDPVSLATKRTATFWNRKVVLASTPTIKDVSRIEAAWFESDRRRYYVPCPHCGESQVLRWKNLIWNKREERGEVRHEPETACYMCRHCAATIEETDKPQMLADGAWVAENPGSRIAGFHISGLYSPWTRWEELVVEWLAAQGHVERMQVFINTVLGEAWEDREGTAVLEGLAKRAEKYPADVPDGVGILTAGVDVHPDRLEAQVVGWGEGEEAWLLGHWRIHGDTESEETWQRLDHYLLRKYRHESGADLRISATMVDSGAQTRTVYRFVRPRESRNVWAAKGTDTLAHAPLSRSSRRNRDGVKLWTIGTYSFKDTLFSRLRLQRPGPRYIHFCAPTDTGTDAEYFAQFGAEKAIIQRTGGMRVRKYVQVRDRNEAIDLWVLSIAALHALGPAQRERLGQAAEKARAGPQKEKADGMAGDEAPGKRGSGWVNSWKR